MNENGEEYFRSVETEVLKELLAVEEPFVLALGGGTPMTEANRKLLENCHRIHLTADREEVFARIPKTFFPGKDLKELWNEREQVYKGLANETINF